MWEYRLRYFMEVDNWLEVSILICTLAYLICVYTDPVVAPHFGAVAVLLAWMEMTFMIGRIPSVGVYVYMIFHVVKILFVLLVFFCFILVGRVVYGDQIDMSSGFKMLTKLEIITTKVIWPVKHFGPNSVKFGQTWLNTSNSL